MPDQSHSRSRSLHYGLWVIQVILAMVFLFAGIMKLVVPAEQMKGPVELPSLFLRFIGVCETLGGLGLILPGIFRVRTGLTPLAAAGLVVIMIGATATTLAAGMVPESAIPALTGILSALVAWGRWSKAPLG